MDTAKATATLSMGRTGPDYYFYVRFGPAKTATHIRTDLTAEQFAQLVTGESVTLQVEVKQNKGAR